jgi:predicted O-linked N-acetylglucosamine transferase (SPINDLY family)
MDYVVADHTLIPTGSEHGFTEKIIFLPDTYQVNDRKRSIAPESPARVELGLPPHDFVFCCFNNNYKILPETFSCWMRIMKRVPGSVLWLLEDNPSAAASLRRHAGSAQMQPDRLVFANRVTPPEHLARHRRADLFLDTLPYNAHTTASDALWAGLPVLTCTGDAFAARVAASLLSAVGLPELITSTRQDYEDMAVALATDPQQLRGIRDKLAHHRLTAPLFDSQRFTKHLEAAYIAIHRRYLAGLLPDHISLGPD